MPRGDPSVWKQHGASYSQLAGTLTSVERANELAPRRLPPVQPGEMLSMRSMRPAGTPAGTLPRGVGTFALQSTWSITMPGNGAGWTGRKPRSASGATASTTAAAAASAAATAAATGRSSSRPPSTAPPSPAFRATAASSIAAAGAISAPGTASGAATIAAAGKPSATIAAAGKPSAAASTPAAASTAASPAATSSSRQAVPATTVAATRSSLTTTLVSAGGQTARTYITENNCNYLTSPGAYRRTKSATLAASEMPKPSYPNDWCTSKQVDYRPDRLHPSCTAPPARPVVHRDNGRLLPTDVPPASQFMTQHRSQFVGRPHAEAAAMPASGNRGTAAAGYNIITGAAPYGNNAFEHWDGRDYRRHR